jgi:peptidoglycan/LPS O-acetylase OafA/YrhL
MVKGKRILTIEAIRGFAAIYVLLSHIVQLYRPYSYFPKSQFIIKTIFGYAHEAVILFFIVSGFSIYYSSRLTNFKNIDELKLYFFKRFRRIYPIFFISLFLALLVLYITDISSNLISNILSFLFLTDISTGSIANPIPTNFPIWSLTYEVFYYCLYPFLLIAIHRYGLKKVTGLVVIVSFLASLFYLFGYPNYFSNVIQYYWTWMAGVVLADLKINKKKIKFSLLRGMLILSIAFMLTFEKIAVLRDSFWALFFCIIFLSFFCDKFKTTIKLKIINFLVSSFAIIVCMFFTYYDNILFHPAIVRIILSTLFVVSIIIPFINIRFLQSAIRFILKPFVKSGSYSYALYIIHWPTIILFDYLFIKNIELNFFPFLVLIIINLAVIFLFSYVLELRIQPFIARKLSFFMNLTSKK